MDLNVGDDIADVILSSPQVANTENLTTVTPETKQQAKAKGKQQKKRTKTADINELVAMGFPRKRAKIAYESTQSKEEAI